MKFMFGLLFMGIVFTASNIAVKVIDKYKVGYIGEHSSNIALKTDRRVAVVVSKHKSSHIGEWPIQVRVGN